MKKVLLCERDLSGHRKQYMRWLASIPDVEIFVFAPENVGVDDSHFISLQSDRTKKNLRAYSLWGTQLRQIVMENKIDVVHILDGDSIMRYFGWGFLGFRAERIIITYHHFFEGFARKISYRMMNWAKGTISVVHTENVKEQLRKTGVKQITVCQYPAFEFESLATRDPEACKRFFHLPSDVPVIGIVGGMSGYKNIIPFLNAMNACKQPFHILICGAENDITEKEIRAATEAYSESVTTVIRQLSDDEYKNAIVASDIIYCIYGHEFNGASGPLTDGVCAGKMILACRHGSLGEIVSYNHLGYVAECDNAEEVTVNTENALCTAKEFQYDPKALSYRSGLQPKQFCNNYKMLYSGYEIL